MDAISSSVRRAQTPDGAILLDVERGRMFSLNPTGSKILELLAAGNNEDQIAEQISAAYGEAIDTVRQDVHDFLEALNHHRILERRDPAQTVATEATGASSDPI
jgi:Coenzyme PQQ synthesis protein D (PqqD)